MANIFEQTISQNSRCFACGSIVYAVEKKITTHHIYHNRCFRCRICKRNLTGLSLNEEGDDIYCTNCYRRKQRGDCNSFEFFRAAAEKAQYVHSRQHNEQSSMSNSIRSTANRDFNRQPSLALRQLERQFHSYHMKTEDETKVSNKNYLEDNESILKNEITPTFSFIPVLRSETIITPRASQIEENSLIEDQSQSINTPTGTATGAIEFRLHKSNVDLTFVTSPKNGRKSTITQNSTETSDINMNKFRIPQLNIRTVYRRSSSANRLINPLKLD